jgi:hypothetical protein
MSKKDYKEDYNKDFIEDCKAHNFPILPPILPSVRRIIVIGDIHGDYKLAVKCFEIAKVIKIEDNKIRWTTDPKYKDTIVVQIGDQVDRCRPFDKKCDQPGATVNDEGSDIKILELFSKLDYKARKHGGKVISLLGNHEIMNVTGNLNYVSYEGLEQFNDYKDPDDPNKKFESGKEARAHAFARGNQYAKYMACTRLSSIIIGNFIFVHAGIVPEFTDKLNIKSRDDLYKINYSVRKWLLGKWLLNLIDTDYVDKIVNSSPYSMFWDRILGAIPPNVNNKDDECTQHLDPVLDIFNVGHMFVGHTPQPFKFNTLSSECDGITATCDNKLWRVDNGASQAFDNFDKQNALVNRTAQVLEILNDDDSVKDTTFQVLKESKSKA